MSSSVKDYEIDALIGRNEAKHIAVYHAVRNSDKENVALKTHISDYPIREDLANLDHEYHILKKIDNPNIVHAYELIHEKNRSYLVLEFVDGLPLKAFIQEKKKIDLDSFYKIAIQMTRILENLHAQRIVHKDFNPMNIIINPKTLGIVITDFSLSSELQSELASNVLEGTLAYISPEQTGKMNRAIDFRSDFYSLGISFYEMLTGVLPFSSYDPAELIYCHLTKPPPPIDNIPPLLKALINKLMSKSAEDRYVSAKGIREDLMRLERNEQDFELGQSDVKNTLLISQKLYGREALIQQFLLHFETFLNEEESELLLVKGPSGIGKSVLIQEIQKPLASTKGIFLKGKYDILQKDVPFFGFVQVIKELIQYLLTQKNLNQIKEDLQKNIGSTAGAIANFVPEMKVLMDPLMPLEPLPAKESQNRLFFTFEKFFSLIATKEQPLVMALDDLQGVDQPSLDLMQHLIRTVPHLFFIGSYRDNEVSSTHPLILALNNIRKHTTLTVAPLDQKNIENLLQDTLGRQNVSDLAKQIFLKTNGNPFFVLELLKTLYQKGYISFQATGWEFDLIGIEQTAISDNVIDLLKSKIQKLSPACQEYLSLAACIRGNFEIKTLSIVTEERIEELATVLWEAVEENLITTKGTAYKQAKLGENISYQFVHDKIQEAAYQLVPDKKPIHLKIARHLLEQKQPLFDILDQYNRCLELIEDRDEKKEIAALNFQAAKRAKASNAYSAALAFLDHARQLNGLEDFDSEVEYAENQMLLGQFTQAEKRLQLLIPKAHNKKELLRIYTLLADQYCNSGKNKEAIDYGIKGLRLIGIKLSPNSSFIRFLMIYFTFKLRLLFINKERLKDLPLFVETQDKPVPHPLVGIIYIASTNIDDVYLRLSLTLKAMLFGFKYGVTPPSSGSYLVYSLFLFTLNKFKDAVFWQNLAYQDALKINQKKFMGRVHFGRGLLNPFCGSSEESLVEFNKAISNLMESGDFSFLNVSFFASVLQSYVIGKSLQATEKAFADTLQVLKRSHDAYYEISSLCYKLVQSLRIDINGDISEEIKSAMVSVKNAATVDILILFYNSVLFIYNDYQTAYREIHEKRPSASWFLISNVYRFYFSALTIFAVYPSITKEDRKFLKDAHKQMKIWAYQAPNNFTHLYLHLSAELAVIDNEVDKALTLYDQALEKAEENGFSLYAAIISECAARFFATIKHVRLSKLYLQVAHYHYSSWGASKKVKQLEEKFPDLKISTPSSQSLDFDSILKASQALSSEILMERLIQKLMSTLKENAGAQKVLLIFEKDGNLLIEGESLPDEQVRVNQNIPLQEENAPLSIINYVFRSKQSVVLHDASKQIGQFQHDPYLANNRIKSVLCAPIASQAKILGVLYLENNLVSHAFTEERLNIVNIISSQAAISLENSRFFERLNKLYRSTERFVPKPFLEILHKKSIEDVALGDGVEQEVSVLFTDLRNFTTISQNKTPTEAFTIVNRYLKSTAPIIREHQGFINQFLGDGILALFPKSPEDSVQAAKTILSALKQFNQEQKEVGQLQLEMGIGINTGMAMMGILGEEERIDPAVISDVINTAARVESLNKTYGTYFLITDHTFKALLPETQALFRLIDKVYLKGRDLPTCLYEFITWEAKLQIALKDYLERFSRAFLNYEKGDFRLAHEQFAECQHDFPEDPVVAILSKRCEQFTSVPPKNWDGIFHLTHK